MVILQGKNSVLLFDPGREGRDGVMAEGWGCVESPGLPSPGVADASRGFPFDGGVRP
jgi:hypothetical protein